MKFFDKMYVGFQRARYQNDLNPRLLGFAVPYGKTKSEQSRMKTVDGWAQKDLDARIIDNTPTRGFKLLEVVSRYSTSNKLFRVQDPRGFELEISADNLLDLCLESTIVNGEIIDDCVWCSHNKIYLIPTKSEHYKLWKKNDTSEKTKIEEGKYYASPGNLLSVFRYEGIYHNTFLNVENYVTDAIVETDPSSRCTFSRRSQVVTIRGYETRVEIEMNTGNKPSYVFTEFVLDEDGNVRRKVIQVRKSQLKNMKPYSEEIHSEMENFKFDPLGWVTKAEPCDHPSDNTVTMSCNTGGIYMGFFKNKEGAKIFSYDEIIKTIAPNQKGGYGRHNRFDASKFVADGYYAYYGNIHVQPGAKQTFCVTDKR